MSESAENAVEPALLRSDVKVGGAGGASWLWLEPDPESPELYTTSSAARASESCLSGMISTRSITALQAEFVEHTSSGSAVVRVGVSAFNSAKAALLSDEVSESEGEVGDDEEEEEEEEEGEGGGGGAGQKRKQASPAMETTAVADADAYARSYNRPRGSARATRPTQ